MRVIIEFRKPSKRTIWKLQKLDKWLDRHLPPMLTLLSGALFIVGLFAVLGVVGSIECDAPITWSLIRIAVGGFVSMVLGGLIAGGLSYEEES